MPPIPVRAIGDSTVGAVFNAISGSAATVDTVDPMVHAGLLTLARKRSRSDVRIGGADS